MPHPPSRAGADMAGEAMSAKTTGIPGAIIRLDVGAIVKAVNAILLGGGR